MPYDAASSSGMTCRLQTYCIIVSQFISGGTIPLTGTMNSTIAFRVVAGPTMDQERKTVYYCHPRSLKPKRQRSQSPYLRYGSTPGQWSPQWSKAPTIQDSKIKRKFRELDQWIKTISNFFSIHMMSLVIAHLLLTKLYRCHFPNTSTFLN